MSPAGIADASRNTDDAGYYQALVIINKMPTPAHKLYWQCICSAAKNNCSFANDWQWLSGAPIFSWICIYGTQKTFWGNQISLPDANTIKGAFEIALGAFTLTWLVGFLIRLILVFPRAYQSLERKYELLTNRATNLEILFNQTDQQYIGLREEWFPSTPSHIRDYAIEIINHTNHTIDDVTVEWDKSSFTQFIDLEIKRGKLLLESTSIHPKSRKSVWLFALGNHLQVVGGNDILHKVNQFTIRVRGRNAPEQVVHFEYDPNKDPKVEKL